MDENQLTLVEHLNELRTRLIVCLISIALGSILSFPFTSFFLSILRKPADGFIDKLAYFSPTEAIISYFKIAILIGFILSLPVIIYEIFAFVSPAINPKIKKHIKTFIMGVTFLFIIGVLFAYFILLPMAIKFLLSFARDELQPIISIGKYISFTVSLILASGFIFEMPVLAFFLTKINLINSKLLRGKRKYAALLIFIIAAIITPTADVFNMCLLAIPMLFLYEISIWISFFVSKGTTYGAKRT